jgi:hypothetical protein
LGLTRVNAPGFRDPTQTEPSATVTNCGLGATGMMSTGTEPIGTVVTLVAGEALHLRVRGGGAPDAVRAGGDRRVEVADALLDTSRSRVDRHGSGAGSVAAVGVLAVAEPDDGHALTSGASLRTPSDRALTTASSTPTCALLPGPGPGPAWAWSPSRRRARNPPCAVREKPLRLRCVPMGYGGGGVSIVLKGGLV